ncbi:MAG: polymer-forming cytoskeletal protein [Alphaproteobacteria bacterium]|nr:polymer-forming cytoskeletal protein [Alphaproteobacteria bacterium]
MFGKKRERDMITKPGAESAQLRETNAEVKTSRSFGRPDMNAGSQSGRGPDMPMPRRLPPEIASPMARRSDLRGANNSADSSEGKRLIVGRDIVLTGEIRACQKLVVEGRVEASLTDSRSIEIAEFGVFKGSAQIETADISGRFEGDITVHGRLTIRSTGRIVGSIHYAELEVEKGGILSGQIDILSEMHEDDMHDHGHQRATVHATMMDPMDEGDEDQI